jgi:hypothetical protein
MAGPPSGRSIDARGCVALPASIGAASPQQVRFGLSRTEQLLAVSANLFASRLVDIE